MLGEKITEVKNNIALLKPAQPVTIVAATKTVGTDIIGQLPAHGITIAGENRAGELIDKYPALPSIEWHFIGNLQTNKVRSIIDKVSMIQSVDRMRLADVIQTEAARIGRTIDVLIEVNMGGEESKGGITPDSVIDFAAEVLRRPNLRVKGLMTVLPISAPESLYADTRILYERLKDALSGIEYLSMGMSGDYLKAIKHGSNMVRLGSVLFGERHYKLSSP